MLRLQRQGEPGAYAQAAEVGGYRHWIEKVRQGNMECQHRL